MTNFINWVAGKDIRDKDDRILHYIILAWTFFGSIIGVIAMTAEYLGYVA